MAIALGALAIDVNIERTCTLRESVGAALCTPPAQGSGAQLEQLRARIARDPGDADAYVALALADRSAQRQQLVETASQLAPREPNLLLYRAAAAFDRRDWRAAVPALIELADGRDAPIAVKSLAWLVGIGQGALLEPYLAPGSRWLERMLAQMRETGTPFAGALPLVVRALQLGTMDADTIRGYVRDLKSQGSWTDAYALWLSLHGQAQPVLFNGGFDHAFEADGFDWEIPAAAPAHRAGAVVERRRVEERGGTLDVQFTGRSLELPIVRQYLFIAPGRYRLRGEYMARQFRSEGGLQWIVRCGPRTIASGPPVSDTGGLWRRFDLDVPVPADCGVIASLQLETVSASEAALGARGRVAFDAFDLERTGP
jgi:hypothetical protein